MDWVDFNWLFTHCCGSVQPWKSAVIYGRVEAKGIVFDGVADALRVPNTDIRLFGKPESLIKRRMGVALAFDADVEVARVNAKKAAGLVKPKAP